MRVLKAKGWLYQMSDSSGFGDRRPDEGTESGDRPGEELSVCRFGDRRPDEGTERRARPGGQPSTSPRFGDRRPDEGTERAEKWTPQDRFEGSEIVGPMRVLKVRNVDIAENAIMVRRS